jgi:wyosine [tRNA(Phe)-imidazoG37] synthetase (radical SAM superfamily)
MRVERSPFYEPEEIARAVRDHLERAKSAGEHVDYTTFVADGEPTLDLRLGEAIDRVKAGGTRVALITNASLIDRADVQGDLMRADWVSLKVDSVWPEVWRRIDRPHGSLRLESILDGIQRFAGAYRGTLVTETMLVAGLNDADDHLRALARFLEPLPISTAYLAIPTRPPAEPDAHAPDEGAVNRAYQIVSERVARVEYLIGYEGSAFAPTGSAEQDLLGITAVHPMRQDAVLALLYRTGTDWDVVERLLAQEQLTQVSYDGQSFYLRRFQPGAESPVDAGAPHGHA